MSKLQDLLTSKTTASLGVNDFTPSRDLGYNARFPTYKSIRGNPVSGLLHA